MKSKIRTIILFLVCLLALPVAAQLTIKGKAVIIENQLPIPLSYATVKLLSAKDSSFISGTNSDLNGHFQFKGLPNRPYKIQISFIGYKPTNIQALPSPGKNEINLGDVLVSENSVELAEAVVIAQRAEMTVKTDTMEYNADAYKMKENAVVEDLLKRLPGVTMSEEGEIMVNGKTVKKIMVDGKDFFKSNPTLTVKNIPVEIMEKLQVIDDKSELAKLTGIDDGEENTVINITIKKGKKKGWLVNSNIGAGQELQGTDGNILRYNINTFAARLVEESQIGLVANGNNINNQNIGGGASTSSGGTPGLNSFLSGGLNFSSGSDKQTAPYYVNADLTYGFYDKQTQQESNRQYYLQDSTSYQNDTLTRRVVSHGLKFSGRVDYRKIKGWTFSFMPTANIQLSTNSFDRSTHTIAGNMAHVNMSSTFGTTKAPNYNLGGTLTVVRQFAKKGRRFSISLDARYFGSESEGDTYRYYFYDKNQKETESNQRAYTNNSTTNSRIYLSYIEPLGKSKNYLQFVYWARAYNQDNVKNTFQQDDEGEYTILDLPYSKSIQNLTITQQLGLSYRGFIPKAKIIYTAGLDITPAIINSQSYIKNGSTNGNDSILQVFNGRTTWNYAPNCYILYNINKGISLRFDYRGRSQAPSINQLDPTPNETNPLNIRVGNPELKPKFTHWARLRYVNFNRDTQQSFQLMLEGNYVENDIINRTIYNADTGVKRTSPINQSGSWNSFAILNYSRPLGPYFQINNYTNAGLRNNIGFSVVGSKASQQKTIATTTSISEVLGITFKYEWLYMVLKGVATWGNTSYSLTGMISKRTLNYGGIYNIQATLPKDWSISTEIGFKGYSGFSADNARQELIWNAEISKSIFKNKLGSICLRLNDILQQQLSISQVISSNYVEDQYFNTLKSFVMFAFSYRFTSMGKN